MNILCIYSRHVILNQFLFSHKTCRNDFYVQWYRYQRRYYQGNTKIHKYSREKMESLELLRNFTSQIVFWFECDSRRKNIREIGGSRKIVRNIEFIRGRRKNIRSVHVYTEKKIEKRINRIRIVLSKIKKVSKWRREIRMAFFAKAIEKNNCVLYLQIQSLISCVYSSGFSLGNLYRLKRWSKNKKKKNKNSYEYFGRILRDRKQSSLIFSET